MTQYDIKAKAREICHVRLCDSGRACALDDAVEAALREAVAFGEGRGYARGAADGRQDGLADAAEIADELHDRERYSAHCDAAAEAIRAAMDNDTDPSGQKGEG